MQGNFKVAANSFNAARELSMSEELELNITVWFNKAQLELSVDKRACGNINEAAFLPAATKPIEEAKVVIEEKKPVPEVKPNVAPTTTSQPAKPVDAYMNESGDIVIGTKFGWYQNASHVFIDFKIRKGGELLQGGKVKVHLAETAAFVENAINGDLIYQIDLA